MPQNEFESQCDKQGLGFLSSRHLVSYLQPLFWGGVMSLSLSQAARLSLRLA